MITLNRFAQRCLNIMRKRFKMNEHSSRKAFSIRIEAVWRKFDIASKYRSDNLPKYSEDEELAAEMIIYLVAYLKRFGCVEELPSEQRRIILMRIEGHTWEEIAERLEISINTVKTQKTRSYKFLRERLGDSVHSIILCLFL